MHASPAIGFACRRLTVSSSSCHSLSFPLDCSLPLSLPLTLSSRESRLSLTRALTLTFRDQRAASGPAFSSPSHPQPLASSAQSEHECGSNR